MNETIEVPRVWLERLLKLATDDVLTNSTKATILLGYISSVESILKRST